MQQDADNDHQPLSHIVLSCRSCLTLGGMHSRSFRVRERYSSLVSRLTADGRLSRLALFSRNHRTLRSWSMSLGNLVACPPQ